MGPDSDDYTLKLMSVNRPPLLNFRWYLSISFCFTYQFSDLYFVPLCDIFSYKASPARGNAVAGSQMVWRESYAYDRNGNRATKTTPWGVINYEYDAENRLQKKGDVVY